MQTTDNLRKFRREIAGRGINMRSALIAGVGANTDLLVPHLKDGDVVVAAENATDLADLVLAMSQVAYTTFFASNKLFRITMNLANRAADGSKTYFRIVPAAVGDATSVDVESHPDVDGATLITVNAHVSGGTTIDLTAAALVTAVNLSEARKIVTASLPSGTGATAVTATDASTPYDLIGADASTASTAAQAGFILDQGPLAASYDTAADQTTDAGVVYTAVVPGAAGNNLTIEYADDATIDATAGDQPTVETDADGDVTVNIDSGVTTAAEVMSAVNAAKTSMTAALSSGEDGTGVVVTMGATSLADGRDEGRLQFTTSTSAKTVRVQWIGRE